MTEPGPTAGKPAAPYPAPITVTLHVSPAEAALIQKLRSLTAGDHLVILSIRADGLDSVTVLSSGKRSYLRQAAEAPT